MCFDHGVELQKKESGKHVPLFKELTMEEIESRMLHWANNLWKSGMVFETNFSHLPDELLEYC